jgi:hypothetical protein
MPVLPSQKQAQIQEQSASLYSDIANLYLKSFNVVDAPTVDPSVEELLKNKKKIELQKRELSPAAPLRHLAFNLLTRHSVYKDAKFSGVIDLSFAKKWNCFVGKRVFRHIFFLW